MRKVMTKTFGSRLVTAVALVSVLGVALPVGAAAPTTAPGMNKIQCFDGSSDGSGIYSGTCVLNSKGAKGSATLSLNSGDADGDYAGVYTLESKIYNTELANLTQLSYMYSGAIAPMPGNLSYNLPIDSNADSYTDFYLFVDAYYCPGVSGYVDIINDPSCVMYAGGVTPYDNWDAFVAAYPGAKIANDYYAFIVAERTGSEPSAIWTVNNVKFGKGGK